MNYITINKQTYNYKLFDINTLIFLIKTKKELIISLENTIKLLRKYINLSF